MPQPQPLTRAQLVELRDQTAGLLAALDLGDLTATPSMRARLEGATVALSAALGDPEALAALIPAAP